MPFNAATYSTRQTPLHAVDPRVKIVLLVSYSITLFCIRDWYGMAACTAIFIACALLAKLSIASSLRQLFVLWIILGVTLLVNSFSFDIFHVGTPTGLGSVSAGLFSEIAPIPLFGSFGFVPAGFGRGCYYVMRIALLALGSMIITTTTSATELSRSLEQFLKPLKRFNVPTHDLATIVSIALRFIPVTFDEFQIVRSAQEARGAMFSSGGLISRLKAWRTVLIPLFIGLFRRADVLALAMDSRCYGAGTPTHLYERTFSMKSAALLVLGMGLCAVVSALC